ncbi:MAG: uracil-DNA glycosylase family protein [Halobacteriaceae archaeon]
MEHDGVEVTACERCDDLVESRSQIVNGQGPVGADLLFIGEAPGANEDRQGEPFVGRSGEILDEIFIEQGITRDAVRITNCVRCRPPENRDPTKAELEACQDHLEREISIVDPALIVTLGKVPAEHLLGRDVAVTSEAGNTETIQVGEKVRDVLVCVHPAASLYDPGQRETLEEVIAIAINRTGIEGSQSQLHDF